MKTALSPVRYVDSTYWIFLFLIFLGLGFLGRFYYRLYQPKISRHSFSTVEIHRTHALAYRLHQLEFENARLGSQITERALRNSPPWEQGRVSRLNSLEQMLGFAEESGPGLSISIKDSSKPPMLGENPNTGIVHNTDLAQVVNELRAAGAKAIVINDQPISAMTGINCSGPIITINGVRMASPFEIQALGDARLMEQYLKRPAGFLHELEKYDIEVNIAPKDVIIPVTSQGAL